MWTVTADFYRGCSSMEAVDGLDPRLARARRMRNSRTTPITHNTATPTSMAVVWGRFGATGCGVSAARSAGGVAVLVEPPPAGVVPEPAMPEASPLEAEPAWPGASSRAGAPP
jgi:hypothetical protein